MSEKTIEVFFEDKFSSYWIEMSFLHFIQHYNKTDKSFFNINTYTQSQTIEQFVEFSHSKDSTLIWNKAKVLTKITDSLYLLKRLDNDEIFSASKETIRSVHQVNKANSLDKVIIDKVERISENVYQYIKDAIDKRIEHCYDKEKRIIYLLTFDNNKVLISYIKEMIDIKRKEYTIIRHFNEEKEKQKKILCEIEKMHSSKTKHKIVFDIKYKSQIEDYFAMKNVTYSLKSMNNSTFTIILYLNSEIAPQIEIVELNNEQFTLLSEKEINEISTKANVYMNTEKEDTLLIIGESKDIKLARKVLNVQLNYKEKINSIASENQELNKTLNRIKINYNI